MASATRDDETEEQRTELHVPGNSTGRAVSWHLVAVRLPVTALLLATTACRDAAAPTPAELTARAWEAHGVVVAAGEQARTCAEAGAAMQAAFVAHRQAFVDAIALDRDPARLEAATAYIEANAQRYRDLETRMEALSDRCADEPAVQAAFDQMENP